MDYYATYGVAPKSFLVFPTDLVYNDEEAALYLSIYKKILFLKFENRKDTILIAN